MALIVYNKSGSPVTLAGIAIRVVVPASSTPPAKGPGYNVTSELKGLSPAQYATLQNQATLVPLEYQWTGEPEYATPGLSFGGTSTAAGVAYNDSVAPPTGATNLQDAVDYLKTHGGGVPAGRLIATANGLQGGGDLSADRTLSPVYGVVANTVCVGNDARLSNARTPTAHAGTHVAGGTDPVTVSESQVTGLVADLGAKTDKTTQVIAGTGLSGGGALNANVTLAVQFGTTASTAAVGNDARLSDARTPVVHASSHAVGGSDAVTVAESQVTNLVTDLAAKAADNAVVHLAGAESISGAKTFTVSPVVPTPTLSAQAVTKGYVDAAIETISGEWGAPAATVAALRAVTHTPDQLRLCEERQAVYTFNAASTSPDDGDGTICPNDIIPPAPGRWLKIAAGTNNHEALAGLQGGAVGDHSHLLASEVLLIPTGDQKAALAGTGTPSATNVFVTNDDTRLSNARTPLSHQATHGVGGSDAVTVAESQVTNLVTDLAGKAITSRSIGTSGGLQGGGDLTADRTLSPVYGSTAATVAQGNDPRFSDARTPVVHAASHAFGGSDAVTVVEGQVTGLVTDLGNKVETSRQVVAGTGLSGGGALTSDVTLNVQYGATATTACVGNDARLSDARTPVGHKGTHTEGGSDEIVVTENQVTNLNTDLDSKVRNTCQVIAGMGLGGGGALSADITLLANFGTSAGTVTQGDDSRLSDARSPINHASRHAAGEVDPVTVTEAQVTNLVTDLGLKAADSVVVHNTGTETINGVKTFVASPVVPTPAGTNDAVNKAYVDSAVDLLSSEWGPPVLTTAALRAATYTNDQVRLVDGKQAVYQFAAAGTGADDDDLIICPTAIVPPAPGRWFKVQSATQNHEYLSGLLGGAAADHQHLTTAQVGTLPTADQKSALAGTTGFPSATNLFVTDLDSRLSDPRDPNTHAVTHGASGSDAISIDESQVANLVTDLGSKAIATRNIATTNGLQGGGDLSADRSLSPVYGATSGTVCEGSDARLSDARIPVAHATTHASGGSDEILVAEGQVTNLTTDLGNKVATATQVVAGTGLSGGGALTSDVTLAVSYGTAAGTAAQGNDARLSDARTPVGHKATHTAGGSDEIVVTEGQVTNLTTDLGNKVETATQVVAGTGLSGGGTLTGDVTMNVTYGTSASTACEGNDSRLTNARTPTIHATSHATGGGDVLALDEAQITGLTGDLAGKVGTATQVVAGTGLTGGGALTSDVTLSVYAVDQSLVTGLTAALGGKVSTTGDESIAGIKSYTSFPVTPSAAPTTNYQVANKKYVDDNCVSTPQYEIICTGVNNIAPATPTVLGYVGNFDATTHGSARMRIAFDMLASSGGMFTVNLLHGATTIWTHRFVLSGSDPQICMDSGNVATLLTAFQPGESYACEVTNGGDAVAVGMIKLLFV